MSSFNKVFQSDDQLLSYCVEHKCRYHAEGVILPEDRASLSDEEVAFIRNYLYQEDLMNIFGYQEGEFDYDAFVVQINKLYEVVKDYEPFHVCMRLGAEALLSEDMDAGLVMLFAYDYMHWTHRCMAQFLCTGAMSADLVGELHRALLVNGCK